jgi:hypothetical protein
MHNAPRATATVNSKTDGYSAYRDTQRSKRVEIRHQRVKMLKDAGLKFIGKGNNSILIIQSRFGLVDFLPYEESWLIRQQQKRGRGTQQLIELLTQQN